MRTHRGRKEKGKRERERVGRVCRSREGEWQREGWAGEGGRGGIGRRVAKDG